MKKAQNTQEQRETDLLDIIIALESMREARNFLYDLLTPEEIVEFAKRWKAAKMLDDKMPYSYIESHLGLSSTTIARVSKCLKGRGGGYRTMIPRRPKNKLHHTSTSSRMTPDS